jgi:hypothetical protein
VWVGNGRTWPGVQRFSASGALVAGWRPKGAVGAPGHFFGVNAIAGGAIEGREVVVIADSPASLQAFDTSGNPLGHLHPPLETRITLGEIAGLAASQLLFVVDNPSEFSYTGGRLVGIGLRYADDKVEVVSASAYQLGARALAVSAAPGGVWFMTRDAAGVVTIQKFNITPGAK